jgi:hypothetical protein
MRSALRTRARWRHLAAAFDVGRAGFQAHHVRLLQLQFGRVLDGHDALARRDVALRMFSSVVLPEPVPPEIRMFTCAGGQRVQEAGHLFRQRLVFDQVLI